MGRMITISDDTDEIRMSSFDFLNTIINKERELAGEKTIRHNDFFARVKDELEDEGVYENFVHPQNKQVYPQAILTYDQMLLVGMRESKAVRRAVLAKLKELSKSQQQLQYQKDDIDILLPCFDYLIDRGLMSKRETLDKLRIDELADRLDPEHTKRIALKLTPLENINPPHLREEVKRWREYIEKYYIRDPEALVFLKDFKQLYALHTGESYRSVYAFHDDAMEEIKIKGKQYMKGVKLK